MQVTIQTFSNGMQTKTKFKNGWACSKCSCVTEHHENEYHQQICNNCGSPVYFKSAFQAVEVHHPWAEQVIHGIDFTEVFARDKKTHVLYHHKLHFRTHQFRRLEECCILLDGRLFCGYSDMQKIGVALRRRTD